jgi:calcineurin-like phosphoesterase
VGAQLQRSDEKKKSVRCDHRILPYGTGLLSDHGDTSVLYFNVLTQQPQELQQQQQQQQQQ